MANLRLGENDPVSMTIEFHHPLAKTGFFMFLIELFLLGLLVGKYAL